MKRPNKSSNEFRYKSLVKDGKSSDKAVSLHQRKWLVHVLHGFHLF